MLLSVFKDAKALTFKDGIKDGYTLDAIFSFQSEKKFAMRTIGWFRERSMPESRIWRKFIQHIFHRGQRQSAIVRLQLMLNTTAPYSPHIKELTVQAATSLQPRALQSYLNSIDGEWRDSITASLKNKRVVKTQALSLIKSGIEEFSSQSAGPYLFYACANRRIRKYTKGKVTSFLNLALVSHRKKFGVMSRLSKVRTLELLTVTDTLNDTFASYRAMFVGLATHEAIGLGLDNINSFRRVQRAMLVYYIRINGGFSVSLLSPNSSQKVQ